MKDDNFFARNRIDEPAFLIANRFMDQWSLGRNELATFMMVRRFARQGETFVGLEKLAQRLNCSTKSISRDLQCLEAAGYIIRKEGKPLVGASGKVGKPFPVYTLVDPHREEELEDKNEDTPPDSHRKLEDKTKGLSGELADKVTVISGQKTLPILSNSKYNRKEPNTPTDLFEDGAAPDRATPVLKPVSLQPKIVEEIDRVYQLANPGVDCPWSNEAFGKLKRLLANHATWTLENWFVCIRNRGDSLDKFANRGLSPAELIPHLARYISGPLNQFGNLKETENGRSKTITERNREANAGAKRILLGDGGPGQLDYRPDLPNRRGDGY